MSLWKIAWRSIQQRALASSLTGISMALGVMLVVAVLVIHGVINQSFLNNGGLGYNIVVGAKGGRLDLVLNAVYYLARPVESIPYSYYQEFVDGRFAPMVDKAIPVCLGDMYQDFRVIGTTVDFFDKLDYGGKQYEFASGRNFKPDEYFGAVVGATVARDTGLKTGGTFQPSHSGSEGHVHEEQFTVKGVLKPTGTPNDRAVFINMEGFYMIPEHKLPGEEHDEASPHNDEKHEHDEHDKAHHDHDADEHHDEGDHKHEGDEHEHDEASEKHADEHDHPEAEHSEAEHEHADGDEAEHKHDGDEHKGDDGDHEHADDAETSKAAPAPPRASALDTLGVAEDDNDPLRLIDPKIAEEMAEDDDHDHEHEHEHGDEHEHGHEHGHEHSHEPVPLEQREVTAVLVLTAGLPGVPPGMLYGPELISKINKEPVAQAVHPIREMSTLFGTFVEPLRIVLLSLTVLIVIVAGIGILVSIYNSMSERRHEIAVIRALGAGRRTVMFIVLLESILLSLAGGVAGWAVGHGLIGLLSPWITEQTGISLSPTHFVGYELVIIPGLIVLAAIVGYLPAMAAYRTDVAKALSATP